MTATAIALTPATRSLTVKTVDEKVKTSLKVTAVEALALTGATSLIVATRDNGPKIPSTTIFIAGSDSAVGSVIKARSSKNNMAYGPITVTEVLSAEAAVESKIKAALFVVAGTVEVKARKPRAPKVPSTTVSVAKVKDGTVVAQGVTEEEALKMIAKAKAAKKAALRIVA